MIQNLKLILFELTFVFVLLQGLLLIELFENDPGLGHGPPALTNPISSVERLFFAGKLARESASVGMPIFRSNPCGSWPGAVAGERYADNLFLSGMDWGVKETHSQPCRHPDMACKIFPPSKHPCGECLDVFGNSLIRIVQTL
jgi:hypothetical protein